MLASFLPLLRLVEAVVAVVALVVLHVNKLTGGASSCSLEFMERMAVLLLSHIKKGHKDVCSV